MKLSCSPTLALIKQKWPISPKSDHLSRKASIEILKAPVVAISPNRWHEQNPLENGHFWFVKMFDSRDKSPGCKGLVFTQHKCLASNICWYCLSAHCLKSNFLHCFKEVRLGSHTVGFCVFLLFSFWNKLVTFYVSQRFSHIIRWNAQK